MYCINFAGNMVLLMAGFGLLAGLVLARAFHKEGIFVDTYFESVALAGLKIESHLWRDVQGQAATVVEQADRQDAPGFRMIAELLVYLPGERIGIALQCAPFRTETLGAQRWVAAASGTAKYDDCQQQKQQQSGDEQQANKGRRFCVHGEKGKRALFLLFFRGLQFFFGIAVIFFRRDCSLGILYSIFFVSSC